MLAGISPPTWHGRMIMLLCVGLFVVYCPGEILGESSQIKSEIHLNHPESYLPLEGILKSLSECQVLVLPNLEQVGFSKISNPHFQYDYLGSSLETTREPGSVSGLNIKHLRCAAVISTIKFDYSGSLNECDEEYIPGKDISEKYTSSEVSHWDSYYRMGCFLNLETAKELLFSPKIHLAFVHQEDGDYSDYGRQFFTEFKVKPLSSNEIDDPRTLIDLEKTYYFIYNQEYLWTRDGHGILASTTISQTFTICWFCGGTHNGDKVVDSGKALSILQPYPCTLPDDCNLLWKVDDLPEEGGKHMSPWAPWSSLRRPGVLLNEEVKDGTPFSKEFKVDASAGIAFTLFSVNNETYNRESMHLESYYRLKKKYRKMDFRQGTVIVTGEALFRNDTVDYSEAFLTPMDTLTWALLALSLLSLSLVVGVVIAYAREESPRSVANYFGVILSLSIAGLVDQWQFGRFTFSSLLPSSGSRGRIVIKILILLYLLNCLLLIMINYGYKSVMKANFIAAKQSYGTELRDWFDFYKVYNIGILSRRSCGLIRKAHPYWVEEPFGFVYKDMLSTGMYVDLPYDRYLHPIFLLAFTRDSCTTDILDGHKLGLEEQAKCKKEHEIAIKIMYYLHFVCAENFEEFASAVYRKNLSHLFRRDPETTHRVENEYVAYENMSPEMETLFGSKLAFFMSQEEFPYYWPLFQKLMAHTNLTFAHTPLHPVDNNDFLIEPELGTYLYNSHWMIRRLAALYSGGIPSLLQTWSRIALPPIPLIKPWDPSQDMFDEPKAISLKGTAFSIIFYAYILGMSVAVCAFVQERINWGELGQIATRRVCQFWQYLINIRKNFQNSFGNIFRNIFRSLEWMRRVLRIRTIGGL